MDITNEEETRKKIKEIKNLVGVWNLGMVLNDALLLNMTDEKWEETVNIKYVAAKNLDVATRGLVQLKDFVMFSSVSSLFGNAGQSNYAYGNSGMEEICRKRNQLGLPAKAICWGAIGDVGYFLSEASENNSVGYLKKQPIISCLENVSRLFASQEPVVTSYILNTEEKEQENNGQGMVRVISRIMGTDLTQIPIKKTLSNLGIDSLQTTELKSRLLKQGMEKSFEEIQLLTVEDILSMD
jgi:fatty acid synthase